MKKLFIAAAVSALFAPTTVFAQATAPAAAPTPEHTFTGNMTLITDYRFRGISQTYRLPAIQGGFDYSHSSGIYLGNWNSNVSNYYFPNGAQIEMDLYGGWKGSWDDWGLDVGAIYYYYPGAKLGTTINANNGAVFSGHQFNNGEIYIGGSWKWLSAKYYRAVTDYFGLDSNLAGGFNANKDTGAALASRGSSKGTGYLDITGTWEIMPKTTLVAHAGHLSVKNYGELSYTDYKLGVTYDWNSWLLGAAVVGTNAQKQWYYNRPPAGGGSTKDTGTATLLLSIGKTF